jgi:very-short-patch-repair endonuclease
MWPLVLGCLFVSVLLILAQSKQPRTVNPVRRTGSQRPIKPFVGESRGETIMKECLKELFPNFTFEHNGFYEWNTNPLTGKPLQVDFYCAFARIGIEVDGRQHYEFTPRFHKTQEDFIYQQKKDAIRIENFKRRGEVLIRVPDTELATKENGIRYLMSVIDALTLTSVQVDSAVLLYKALHR